MDNRWKKTVIRSTRFSPVLMDTTKTECKCRRIDFSNYIRFAATAAMKHSKKSGSAEASKDNRRKSPREKNMTDHIVPKRGLRPFKRFLPECFRRTRQRGKHWGKN